MSGNQTYERIIRYLKGLLSNRERHELEKDMMRDPFDDDALEGLSRMDSSELEKDMSALLNRLDDRIANNKVKTRNLTILFRIAAGFILVIGLGTALYLALHKPGDKPLISQELQTQEKSIPETMVPQAPIESEVQSPELNTRKVKKSQPLDVTKAENDQNIVMADSLIYKEIPSDNRKDAAMPAGVKRAVAEAKVLEEPGVDSGYNPDYITGRILGVNRQALAGVTVMEEGTAIAAITDRNGNFRLPVRNTSSKIALKYNGYKSMEVPTREISGKEISMNEDVAPLSEVMVTGYGKKEAVNRVASGTASKSKTEQPAFKYFKPVPPGGSLKAFQDWVENKIDVEKFMELLPGNYKVIIDLTVGTDGLLNQISAREGIPVEVADEYKRVVALSPAWQPARTNDSPVDARVQLIFYLILK
jgi:hypothetical protein